MKQNLLLPHWCKTVGLVLLVPLVVVGVLGVICSVDAFGFVFDNMGLYISLLSAALIMSAFAKEKDEDEYVATVRTRYLMLSFYIDLAFLLVTAFTVFDFGYLNVMAVQMFSILALHIVMFNIAMAVIRRRRGHEE